MAAKTRWWRRYAIVALLLCVPLVIGPLVIGLSPVGATVASTNRLHAPAEPCAAAEALHKAGDDDSARVILSDDIKSNTDTACAQKLLKSLNKKSEADRAKAWLASAWWWGAAAAVVLLVLLALLKLVPSVGAVLRKPLNLYFHPQLVINDLGDYGGTPPAAPSVGALVGARFVPHGADVVPIDQVEAGAELGNAFDAVSKISPQFAQLAAVAQLIQALLGVPRRFSVAGQIHSSPTRGPGITLRLWDQGALYSAATIWRGIAEPAAGATIDDFRELVVPATAWLQHELASLLAPDKTARSTNSLSFALLAAGIDAQQHGYQERAQDWYSRALSVDPTHLRARVALALAYDQSTDKFDDVEAVLLSTLFLVEAELA